MTQLNAKFSTNQHIISYDDLFSGTNNEWEPAQYLQQESDNVVFAVTNLHEERQRWAEALPLVVLLVVCCCEPCRWLYCSLPLLLL